MQVWIGMAHVRPKPGCDLLEGAIGAFVPAVALANSDQDFAERVAKVLIEYGFDVLEVDDIEPLDERQKRYRVAKEISDLATNLTPENPVALSYFDSYETE